MIIKLQNGDKFKIESNEEARRKFKEYSQLPIGQKLKRNLNIASNFLKSGPSISNFGNAVSALFGGYSPEDPDLHYGEAPGVGIKNFGNLVRTARVAKEFNDVVKGPVNQFKLLNNFIEKFVTNPKGSGKLIHYDKGNGKSIYQKNRGASIINGKLVPGKTKREGQKNYTWWNTDNPYINVHKAKEGPLSPTRYIVVDDNTQFKHPFDLKEPVGQSAGKGRGFILPTERVTDKPVDLTNAEIYEKSPFGWWENIRQSGQASQQQTYPWQLFNEKYNRIQQPNGKIRLSLNSSTESKPRQMVLEPKGNNKYHVHMRIWDDIKNKVPGSIGKEDKQTLFDALYNELPEGSEILFPQSGPGNYGTRGTVAGLKRLSKDPRFTPGTKGTLQYLDKDGKTIKTYEGTSFIKGASNDSQPNVYVPDNQGWKELSYPAYINHVWSRLKAKGIKTEPFDRSNTSEQTRRNFFTKGFNPVFKLYPQANLRAHAQEILRRMKNFGLDVDNTIGELPLYGKGSIKNLVTLNAGRTSYIGYYNKPGVTGTYFHNNGTSIVDPGYPEDGVSPLRSIVSTMHHERNMHGTQKFLTPEMWKPYEDFLSKMISKVDYDPRGFNVAQTPNGRKLAIGQGSHKKEELRATIGELVKNIYDTYAYDRAQLVRAAEGGPDIKKYDLEILRPHFEKVVDAIPDSQLERLLRSTNGYGEDYVEIGPKENPNFFDELRTLLKIAPSSLPFLIPRKEENK